MREFAHYIKENRGVTIPKRIVYFDTETYMKQLRNGDVEQKFHLATACSQRIRNINTQPTTQWLETKDSIELCDWILSKAVKKERLYIMSANIWFDIRVSNMLYVLKRDRWQLHKMFLNGMSLIISFKQDKKTIVFLNFQNFFRTSVEKIGLALNYPKLKVDFNTVSEKELMIYCRRDTDILRAAMYELFRIIKLNELGNFSYTIPSIAFNVYRHGFMKHKLLVHCNKSVQKLERQAYFGGRVDCFRIGKFKNVNLVQVDINSMYPFIMKTKDLPTILKYNLKDVSLSAASAFIKNYCVTAHVDIETPERAFPARITGKCCFPIGRFTTFLSTGSFEYALNKGYIKKIHQLSVYYKHKIFSDYVDYFYNARLNYAKNGNMPFSMLCKILLNSLYGKFGQRHDKVISEEKCNYTSMKRENYYDLTNKKHYIITELFGKRVTVERNVSEGFNSIVSIAAHVTDYSRMYLWKWIDMVGMDAMYYCDTDCLIFDENKFDINKLPISDTELGAFKVEGRDNHIDIRGLKDYDFRGVNKIKGVSSKAVETAHNTYSQNFFPSIFTELTEGLQPIYKTRQITKCLRREYTKGIVTLTGFVEPLFIDSFSTLAPHS